MLVLSQIEWRLLDPAVPWRRGPQGPPLRFDNVLALLQEIHRRTPGQTANWRTYLRDTIPTLRPTPDAPIVISGTLTVVFSLETVMCYDCGRTEGGLYGVRGAEGMIFCVPCFVDWFAEVCITCANRGVVGRGQVFCQACAPGPVCQNCLAQLDNVKAGLCDVCAVQGALVPYGANVPQVLRTAPVPNHSHRPQLLGVELEIAPLDRTARLNLRDAVTEFALLKADRSIMPDDGVEIVTVPMTLEEHFIKWRPIFEGALQDCRATPRCGLHVHVDAPPRRNFTVAKMMQFVHRPLNEALINQIAGRLVNMVGRPNDLMCFQNPRHTLAQTLDQNWGHAHHSAFNASHRNRHRTLELRIFAATTNWTEFMGRLEFAEALGVFARQVNPRNLDSSTFMKWLKKAPYPFLQFILGLRSKVPTTIPALAKQQKRLNAIRGGATQVAKENPFGKVNRNIVFEPLIQRANNGIILGRPFRRDAGVEAGGIWTTRVDPTADPTLAELEQELEQVATFEAFNDEEGEDD